MKNKKYIWIALAILGIGGYFIYKELKKPNLTKEKSIEIITENGYHSNKDFISKFEEGFLISWAKGILANAKTFYYNNKSYYTQGGTSVK